ncbi:hypothetical protein ACLQ2E_23330 [Streptomyces lavendulocolor]
MSHSPATRSRETSYPSRALPAAAQLHQSADDEHGKGAATAPRRVPSPPPRHQPAPTTLETSVTTPHPLPDQWAINVHPVANLVILTLLDADGAHREIGFHPLTAPGTAKRAVHALAEITDSELRASAQKLIDSFYQRTAQAKANADAFGTAVPDQQHLFDRLRSELPGTPVDLGIDDEALTIVLKLTAAGPTAGALLALIARWPGTTSPTGLAYGVTQDLADDGTLTVTFDQPHAEKFLTWYRAQP